MMIRTSFSSALIITAAALIMSGCHRSTATAISFTMGSAGLQSLTDLAGHNVIDSPNKPPTISGCSLRAKDGTQHGCSNAPTSTTVAGNTVTQVFPWGTIVTTFNAYGTKFSSASLVTNTTGETLNYLWCFPFSLNFGTSPISTTNNVAVNIDAPSSTFFDYVTGTADLVADDIVPPMLNGFWPSASQPTPRWKVTWAIDYGKHISTSYRIVNSPVGPGASRVFPISIRFGPTGSNEQTATQDVFSRFAATYPHTVQSFPYKPLGALRATGNHRSAPYPTNPRGWFNDSKVDTTTPAGISAFQQRFLAWGDGAVAESKRVGISRVIIWDFEGQQYASSYICDPTQIETIAPETAGVLDAFVHKFTAAGIDAGFCLRPQSFSAGAHGVINVNGMAVSLVNGTQFQSGWQYQQTDSGTLYINGLNYQVAAVNSPTSLTLKTDAGHHTGVPYIYATQTNTPDPEAELRRKIDYARQRWGTKTFYIDSSTDWDRTVTPAIVWEHLMQSYPDTLLIPETVDTRHYAYSYPYDDATNNEFGTTPEAKAIYPNARGVVSVSDQNAAQKPNELTAAAAAGNLLITDAWYPHKANDFVKTVYENLKR